MGKECQKCGYVRKELKSAPDYECPSCGRVYLKVEQNRIKEKDLKYRQERGNSHDEPGNDLNNEPDSPSKSFISKFADFGDSFFQSTPETPKWQRYMERIMFFIGLPIAVALLVSWKGAEVPSSDEPDAVGAFTHCEFNMRNSLKAPATADFALIDTDKIYDLGNGRFKVISYVDAQNSFGAQVRTHYTCVARGRIDGSWIIENFLAR